MKTAMRIRNLSTISIPKRLWRGLANSMGLDGTLPQAKSDEFGIYGRNRTLRVSINPNSDRGGANDDVVLGTYTFGHISLFPCPKCTSASLTHTFLHELYHAWLHQYYEELYETTDTCNIADEFADESFKVLGGSLMGNHQCADFNLDDNYAAAQLPAFAALLSSCATRMKEK